MEHMNKKKIICLGDSITEGYPFFGEKSWVFILNSRMDCNFINKGISGQTSCQIAQRFEQDVLNQKPDGVTLLFGSNDFLFTNATPEDVLEQTATLALTAREKGIQPVLFTPLLTVPELACRAWDDGTDYIRVNSCLSALRTLLLGLAEGARIPCLDLQPLYSAFVKEQGEQNSYEDGLHPSIIGYQTLARFIENFFRDLFYF